jgi:putative SOS response-associated peptidase YedK
MCGRFAFYSPHEAVVRLFGVAGAPPVEPRWNIAPTRHVATVRADADGRRELSMLHWGLVPSWAKERSIGQRMNNARGETLGEKPSFRNAWRRRRCLVLADGWYEWQRAGTVKQPHYFHFEDREPFGMAGLWETWRDPAGGDLLESCCIVTTEARGVAAPVHDRMPVIVPRDRYAEWLDPRLTETSGFAGLIADGNRPGLVVATVSRRVNDARNEGPDLVLPLATPDGLA